MVQIKVGEESQRPFISFMTEGKAIDVLIWVKFDRVLTAFQGR